jgi:hypothetical protein
MEDYATINEGGFETRPCMISDSRSGACGYA